MKAGQRRRADRVIAGLAVAMLCALAGHTVAQGNGADREALGALSNTTGGHISSQQSSSAIFVPVLLTASGLNNSYYTSELTLTNRGGEEATLHYTYTAHRGGGSGTATDSLAPGRQRIQSDAIGYLTNLGMPIPHSGNRIGTLRVEVSGSSEVGVSVRTTTSVPEGRAGLAYQGIAIADGFEEAVYLCGLRQNSQDRSNVAFQNMGTPQQGNVTLRTTVYSGEAENRSSHVLPDVTLPPGGFHQYNGILNLAGFDNGYVMIERVKGSSPFYAYGVINDQANSDGSFVFPLTAGSLMGTTGQTLPVIVETGVFTSELIVTNFSEEANTLHFRFVDDGLSTPDRTARFSLEIGASQQRIIPDVIDTQLRQKGVEGVSPLRGGLAGALFAKADRGDMSGIVIGARTSSSDGRGGHYGVFYHALPDGSAFTKSVWIHGLQQNQENRSNLALVNTGEVDSSPSVFQLDIYNGATGSLVNTVIGLRVAARGWRQINGILRKYAPGTTQGYVRIRKMSGNNPFLAYGVINDGGAPGQRSGDGAYLPATEKRIIGPGTEAEKDREVLEAFYYATDGPNWNNRAYWLSELPLSEWYGVNTDENGRVTGLSLDGNHLSGEIPPELGQISQLQVLELTVNQLTGTIPPEVGRLTNLRRLVFAHNELSETIPPELGALKNLQVLNLGSNQLSGEIPPELGQLTMLQWLALWHNELSGWIPPELGGLTQLQEMFLGYNQLSGAIPKTFQQLSKLTKLDLRKTDVCVPMDAAFQAWLDTIAIFRSSGLVCDGTRRVLFSAESYTVKEGETVTVSVRLIDQTGDPLRSAAIALTATPGGGATAADYAGVPESVTITSPVNEASFVVTTVKDDHVDHGETVVLGFRRPLPSGITAGDPDTATVSIHDPGTEAMTDREVLEAFYYASDGPNWNNRTNWLSELPLSEWYGVDTDESGRVTGLSLDGNHLSGEIPPVLSRLTTLQWLNLRLNQLSGEIPPELGQLSQLQVLNLPRNQLSGEIPPELGQISQLQVLELTVNQLTGTIPPELGGLTNLLQLRLGGNRLSGAIPPELSGLTKLQELYLVFNELSGTIPPELGQLSHLQLLYLGGNRLSGAIPPELGGLAQLQVLELTVNRLSGAIPPELGGLTHLQRLWFDINRLSGPIPPELGALNNLQELTLWANELTGEIPPELGQLSQLQRLDLRSNWLRGLIPPELGQLTHLQQLHLWSNELSGTIPPELSQLTHLKELNLSFNQDLTGTLPPGLQQLPLSTLNLMATSVCVPENTEYQEWLTMIEFIPPGLTCGRPTAAMSEIDIAVLYTPAARRIAGGTAEMEAVIDLLIAETNQAYVDSGVNQHLILAARQAVQYTESSVHAQKDLDRLASATDGHMDEIHTIRDQAGADLVHLIADPTGTGGIAHLAGAYGLTCAGCGSGTFAHELGHNMGLSHDRYIDGGYGLFPYSYGYVNQQAFTGGALSSARWKTIMAYPNQCGDAGFSCVAILRFSNPNQTYRGDLLGVPGDERTLAVDGPADAVRTLNLTRHSVASFRPRSSRNRSTRSSPVSQAPPVVRTGEAAFLAPGSDLFRAVAPNERGAASLQAGGVLDRATLRRRDVSVDIQSLARVSRGGNTALRLNLFDDVVLMGIIERRTPTYSGGYALSGRLAGVAEGRVTLVVNGSVVAGTVRLPGATYRIRPTGAGRHAIIQVDPSRLPVGCETVSPTTGRER